MPYVGPAPTPNAPKDLQGGELKLDADADTSITADTEDTIHFKIAGADDFTFTANTFTAESGSTIAAQALTATTFNATGATTAADITASGIIKTDATTEATSTTDGSLQTDGGLSVVKDAVFGDDLKLLSDSSVIHFGNDLDVTLTHAADTSLTCNLMMAATTFEPTGDTAAGDNAAIGYTAAEGLILTGQGSTGDITLKNDADEVVFQVPTGTDDIKFPDGAKAIFGADSDLSIYNNGTSGTFVAGTQVRFYTADFGVSNAGASESMISASQDGAVTLYHNNAAKIATVATGINVKGGVTFDSDTAEANNLDDYEEGSWTPAQNGVTAAAASGVYTKVGRMVYAFFTMTTATTSDASSMQVSGLPFACASIDGSCAKGYDNYEATNNSHAYVPNGQSYVQFTQNTTGASTNAVHTGKLLKICAIYQAAT